MVSVFLFLGCSKNENEENKQPTLSFTDLVVNNKNSISKDEILAQVKGDKDGFTLKTLSSEDKNILLVKGTKPNFTIEVKKAGNTNLNLTLEKSSYEDINLKGKVQVKVFSFTFDKLKTQANKITATEILANVKGSGKDGFTLKSITLKDNTFGNVKGTKPNLEIKLTKFGVFKADLVLEKSGNFDVKITDAEFIISKQTAPTDLTFSILQKKKASGGNFTASEILDSVKGTKTGYSIKEIKDINPSTAAKVASDGKSIDFVGSGSFRATLVLEHSTKEDVTLIKSKFAIIPKADQFNIEEFTPTLTGGGTFPSYITYSLDYFNNTFYLFGNTGNKYYSSTDCKDWKEEQFSVIDLIRGKPLTLVFNNKLWVVIADGSGYSKVISTDVPNSGTKLNFSLISDDKIPLSSDIQYTNIVEFKNNMWIRLEEEIGYTSNGKDWNEVWKGKFIRNTSHIVYDNKIWTFGGLIKSGSGVVLKRSSKVYSFDGTNLVEESNLPIAVAFIESSPFVGGILLIGGNMKDIGGNFIKNDNFYWSAYGKRWNKVKTDDKIKDAIAPNSLFLKSPNEIWLVKLTNGQPKVYKITFTP